MASFDFNVDTSPMASAMSGVTTHVAETTVAVAAMQAAVIAAEKAAADKLCADIDNGFYCLMQSQLSMKKTEHFSNLRTNFLSLREMGKDLCSKQERMEQDVARIQREYYKIFHSIDMSLEKQMRELDTATYQVADQRDQLITSRQLKDIAETMCYSRDISAAARNVLTAKMKKRIRRTLDRVGENVMQNQTYQDRMEKMLNPTAVEASSKEYIPVIYAQEASTVMPGMQVSELQMPEGLNKDTKNPISIAISEKFGDLNGLKGSQEERERVRTEFLNLVNSSNLEPRVADVVMGLFERGGYK